MNITGIARENFEEAGLPLKNTIELTTKNEYTIPDIWGLKVGRKFLDTGEIASHFEEQQFFEIRKRATLLEYPHTVNPDGTGFCREKSHRLLCYLRYKRKQ